LNPGRIHGHRDFDPADVLSHCRTNSQRQLWYVALTDRREFSQEEPKAMTRRRRDFYCRDSSERVWMLESTWCEDCRLPDLGIDDPTEFEEDGLVYIEGRCRICGCRLTSEIVDQRSPPPPS
jgi:hypothetical protein